MKSQHISESYSDAVSITQVRRNIKILLNKLKKVGKVKVLSGQKIMFIASKPDEGVRDSMSESILRDIGRAKYSAGSKQQILNENDLAKLAAVAKKKNSSIEELINKAVKKTYLDEGKENEEENWIPEGVFGAWKDHPMSDEELMNVLSGPGVMFDYD